MKLLIEMERFSAAKINTIHILTSLLSLFHYVYLQLLHSLLITDINNINIHTTGNIQ